ncbi:MAG: transketolase C-terminal domain-containing protein, partial [Rhodospirillales bacterium]
EAGKINITHIIEKIDSNRDKIVRFEADQLDDAEVVVVSYGITSRIAIKAVMDARKQGIKTGNFRMITAWPFPEKQIREIASKVKAIVVPEINYGPMVMEVERLAAGKCKVVSVNSTGGAVHDPKEILAAIKEARS